MQTRHVDKSEIRSQIRAGRRELRQSLGDDGWAQRADRIAEAVLGVEQVAQAAAAGVTVASYVAVANEPPTNRLNEALTGAGARVVVPVTEHDGVSYPDLGWAEPGTLDVLATGANGLAQLRCAVVLVPALAVTSAGARLGQGGGYYDRMFAGSTPGSRPYRLALIGTGEVLPDLPTEDHDQLVDGYVAG